MALPVCHAVAAFNHHQCLEIGLLDGKIGAYLADLCALDPGRAVGRRSVALGNQPRGEVLPGDIDNDSNPDILFYLPFSISALLRYLPGRLFGTGTICACLPAAGTQPPLR